MPPLARPLLVGHLEGASARIFSEYPAAVRNLVGRAPGIYALYKADRLYYVGLARDLRVRLRQHENDRHAGKWDRFSIYLVREVENLSDLEALLLRIAAPKGNTQAGAPRRSKDLSRALHRAMADDDRSLRADLLGRGDETAKRRRHASKPRASAGAGPVLKRLLDRRRLYPNQRLYATVRGKLKKAQVLPSGNIKFGGKVFSSIHIAGSTAAGWPTCNGWIFWHLKTTGGKLVPLDRLR